MQGYNSMPMPMPSAAPTHAASSYGPTGYSPLPPINSTANTMDREMSSLIENLKMSIKDASAEDLESLLGNEDNINTLIEDSLQMKELKNKRNNLIQSNKDQAVFNLSLQPELEGMKEKLSEAILMQSSKKEEYDILKSKLESLAGSFSLDTTLALLQAAASENDTQTEKISDKLIDDDMSVDEFLQTYVSERTNYHLLRIKADRLAEIVRGGGVQARQGGNSYYGTGYGRY